MTSAQKNLDRLVWFGLEITQCYDNLFYWFGLVVGWGLVISVCLKRVLVAKFFFNYPKMKMAWMCVWQIRGDHFIIYPLPRTEGADIGFCWIINLIFYWFYRYGDHAIQERGNINVFVVPHKCITLKRKSLTLCCRVHRHLDRSWCTRSEQWCYENAQFSRSEIIWLLTIKKFIHQNTSL